MNDNNPILKKSQSTTTIIQEYLMFDDLEGLNSSPQSIRSKFSSYFEADPDGIALNHETYFNAVKPPITEQYGHYCYKNLGMVQYTDRPTDVTPKVILTTETAVNNTDEPSTIAITLSANCTKSTTVSTSATVGVKYNAKLSLEKIFDIGGESSISVTIGQATTDTTSYTVTKVVNVTVPPHSKRHVQLIAKIAKESADFSAPITVSGMLGANFPKKVGPGGHYFWFLDAKAALNSTAGTLLGTIANVTHFDFESTISEVYSLNSEQKNILKYSKFGDPN